MALGRFHESISPDSELQSLASRSAGYHPVSPLQDDANEERRSVQRHEKSSPPKGLDGTGADQGSHSRSFFSHFSRDTWALETLGWLLAALSLAVILVLLGTFNNQPLRNFHSNLTLNTLVSVIGQIGKTALIVPVASSISQLGWLWYRRQSGPLGGLQDVDRASRGLMDSVRLPFRRPKEALAYLGAVNTVLILLFGPFAQQSVTFPLRDTILDDRGGSMPRALAYRASHSSDVVVNFQGGNQSIFTFDTVLPAMKNAIDAGLSDTPAHLSDVPGSCPTGNCTFPDVPSLAVCSDVSDVTSDLVEDCGRWGADDTREGCTYTVPALKDVATWRKDNFSTAGADFSPNNVWIGASHLSGTTGYEKPNNLAEFYVIYLKDTSVLDLDHPKNFTTGLAVLKGTLSLCVKTYRTNMNLGQTAAELADVESDLEWKWDHHKVVNKTSISAVMAKDSSGDEYYIDQATLNAFVNYLSTSVFWGSYQGALGVKQSISQSAAESNAVLSFAMALYKDKPNGTEGLKRRLANLETAMSNAMRTTSDTNDPVLGRATYSEAYIAINFRWLIVPIVSVLLALLLLVAVVISSRRAGLPAWKDSQTRALLAIEPETRLRVDGVASETVRAFPVRLHEGEDRRWRLRAAERGASGG